MNATIKKTIPALSFCCALVFNQAHAGSMGPVQAGCCWTGPYFGLSVEAGSGAVRQSYREQGLSDTISGTTLRINITSSGVASGRATGGTADFFLGYRIRPVQSKFIYGLQLNGNFFNSIEAKTTGVLHVSGITTLNGAVTQRSFVQSPFELGTRPTELVNLSGRVGVLIQEPTQFYGLIGIVGGRFANFSPDRLNFTTESTLGSLFGSTITTKTYQWRPGVIVGAGIEHQLTAHWSVLAEYHFTSFRFSTHAEDQNSNFFTNASGTIATTQNRNHSSTTDTRYNFNSAAVGVVYRWC
jgi:opacity protein-like surface antigen